MKFSAIKTEKYSAFSLLEVIFAISLLTIVAAFSIPITVSAITSNDLEVTTDKTVEALRTANSYARASRADDAWGVKITSENIVVFKGTDFGSREVEFDELFPKTSEVTISGSDEVYFGKSNGTPSNLTQLQITSQNGKQRTIEINQIGQIDEN